MLLLILTILYEKNMFSKLKHPPQLKKSPAHHLAATVDIWDNCFKFQICQTSRCHRRQHRDDDFMNVLLNYDAKVFQPPGPSPIWVSGFLLLLGKVATIFQNKTHSHFQPNGRGEGR